VLAPLLCVWAVASAPIIERGAEVALLDLGEGATSLPEAKQEAIKRAETALSDLKKSVKAVVGDKAASALSAAAGKAEDDIPKVADVVKAAETIKEKVARVERRDTKRQSVAASADVSAKAAEAQEAVQQWEAAEKKQEHADTAKLHAADENLVKVTKKANAKVLAAKKHAAEAIARAKAQEMKWKKKDSTDKLKVAKTRAAKKALTGGKSATAAKAMTAVAQAKAQKAEATALKKRGRRRKEGCQGRRSKGSRS